MTLPLSQSKLNKARRRRYSEHRMEVLAYNRAKYRGRQRQWIVNAYLKAGIPLSELGYLTKGRKK